jgi:hypothetical protein
MGAIKSNRQKPAALSGGGAIIALTTRANFVSQRLSS